MSSKFYIRGGKELREALETLPKKLEKNIMRSAMRAGAKVIADEAKKNLDDEWLRKTVKISTNSRNGQVTGKIKTIGKGAYVTRFIEFGTARHLIKPKNKKRLAFRAKSGDYVVTGLVSHTGMQGKPFLRPAMDSKSKEALNAIVNKIQSRLINEHSLNVRDVGVDDA